MTWILARSICTPGSSTMNPRYLILCMSNEALPGWCIACVVARWSILAEYVSFALFKSCWRWECHLGTRPYRIRLHISSQNSCIPDFSISRTLLVVLLCISSLWWLVAEILVLYICLNSVLFARFLHIHSCRHNSEIFWVWSYPLHRTSQATLCCLKKYNILFSIADWQKSDFWCFSEHIPCSHCIFWHFSEN